MAYINTAYLFKCQTCTHFRSDECNTFCENGECYSPNMRMIPKADVEEVKHGYWQIEDRGGKPTDKPICSQCGATPKYYVNGESSPYCQECGSKMERKVKPYVR